MSWSIGATLLLSAGALGLLEARRREQLRRTGTRQVAPIPSIADITLERTLRSLDAMGRALRIDVAVRAAATRLAPLGRHIVGVLLRDDGQLTVITDAPAATSAPWIAVIDETRWLLPADTTEAALAAEARRSGAPCPALVELGRTVGGSCPDHVLLVDLEAIGLLCLTGTSTQNTPVLQSMLGTLMLSPLAETVRTITTGLVVPAIVGGVNAEQASTLDEALDVAVMHLGSTRTVSGARRTFALRVATGDAGCSSGGGGEAWEPVVVIAAPGAPVVDDALAEAPADVAGRDAERDAVELAGHGGRGLAVVIGHGVAGARWRLSPTKVATPGGAEGSGDQAVLPNLWTIEPLGERFVPIGVSVEQLGAVCGLIDRAATPIPPCPDERSATADGGTEGACFAEQPWSVMVRMLGGIGVCNASGAAVEFGRSKSLELIAWLATHRDRPTRSAARTALWELDVRSSTFANVVSEARCGMARAVPPPVGEEWIERTLTDQLPMHRLVVTDADLLRARMAAAAGRAPEHVVEILRPGLELVADLPFAGTNYLWPDAEGITSALTLLATSASIELGRAYLALGDIDGVFWSTGQGLRVLPGHEELIALRMRAHGLQGNLAGVRGEWEVYERALHADSWSTAEPSPKLIAVRRELLSS